VHTAYVFFHSGAYHHFINSTSYQLFIDNSDAHKHAPYYFKHAC